MDPFINLRAAKYLFVKGLSLAVQDNMDRFVILSGSEESVRKLNVSAESFLCSAA